MFVSHLPKVNETAREKHVIEVEMSAVAEMGKEQGGHSG